MDAFGGALKEQLGAPSDLVIEYYLLEAPLAQYDVCPEHAGACAEGSVVFATDLANDHEMVHVVSGTFGGMPVLFEEGGATYWGGLTVQDSPSFDDLDIREVLDSWDSRYLNEREYALGAHFTSYLMAKYDLERYRSLLKRTSLTQSRGSLESVFEDVYADDLETAITDYEATYPYCDLDATRSSFYECGDEAVVVPTGDDEFAVLEFDLSCSNPRTLGPQTDPGGVPKVWQTVTVELQDLGGHELLLDVPGAGEHLTVSVDVKRCSLECGDVMETRSTHTPATFSENIWGLEPALRGWLFDAPEGRYVLTVSRDADDPGPVRLRLH